MKQYVVQRIEWLGEEKLYTGHGDYEIEPTEARVYLRDAFGAVQTHTIRNPDNNLQHLLSREIFLTNKGVYLDFEAYQNQIADRLTTQAWEMDRDWLDVLNRVQKEYKLQELHDLKPKPKKRLMNMD